MPHLLEPARAAGLRATLTVTGTVRDLPPGIDLAGYRIVQEAVTNVLQHAAAGRIDCTVRYGPDAVEVSVVDDGTGAGSGRPTGGHGLIGMRERATIDGGSLEAGPRSSGGYAIRAVLPLPADRPDADRPAPRSPPPSDATEDAR